MGVLPGLSPLARQKLRISTEIGALVGVGPGTERIFFSWWLKALERQKDRGGKTLWNRLQHYRSLYVAEAETSWYCREHRRHKVFRRLGTRRSSPVDPGTPSFPFPLPRHLELDCPLKFHRDVSPRQRSTSTFHTQISSAARLKPWPKEKPAHWSDTKITCTIHTLETWTGNPGVAG